MFLFTFVAKPKPGTRKAKQFGGAYVNCWIDFKWQDGARYVAKLQIERSGWIVVRKKEVSWVEKDDYADKPELMRYYNQAQEEGVCFVFHTWPRDAKE